MTRRRKGPRRIRMYGRRRTDAWQSLGKLAGLFGSVCAAIIGQAELIGEPWRHYVTIVMIACTAVWGYTLGPQNVQVLLRHVRGWK